MNEVFPTEHSNTAFNFQRISQGEFFQHSATYLESFQKRFGVQLIGVALLYTQAQLATEKL